MQLSCEPTTFFTQGGVGTLGVGSRLVYPRLPDDFKDGTSTTLLFATKYQVCGSGGSSWADSNAEAEPKMAHFGASTSLWQPAPSVTQCNPILGTAVSFLPQSIQVAMCDGTTRSVSVGISPATWAAAHTPSAGDVIGPDWDN
jgi:hypothetical protein